MLNQAPNTNPPGQTFKRANGKNGRERELGTMGKHGGTVRKGRRSTRIEEEEKEMEEEENEDGR